jgi:hypothetical protein
MTDRAWSSFFMLGKYIADETQARKFGWRCLQAAILPFSIGLSPIIILYIASGFSTPLLLIVIVPLITGAGAVLVGSDNFVKIIIILEDERIIRTGAGTRATHIAYADIGSIIVKANGIVLVKKGFAAHWNLLSKWPYLRKPDIIFIPSVIQDYEEIKNFILLESARRKVCD